MRVDAGSSVTNWSKCDVCGVPSPKAPKSPYPMSAARIRITFGLRTNRPVSSHCFPNATLACSEDGSVPFGTRIPCPSIPPSRCKLAATQIETWMAPSKHGETAARDKSPPQPHLHRRTGEYRPHTTRTSSTKWRHPMARTRIFRTTATAQDAKAEPPRRKLPDRTTLVELSPTSHGTSTAANVMSTAA